MDDLEKNYITESGYQKLSQDVKELKEVKRKEIAWKIEQAKELGDLSENAEYQSAKEEQAFMEGRIIELESLLKTAVIIKPKKCSFVDIGSKVTITDGQQQKEYEIVGSAEVDPVKGKISHRSPIGQAFLGKKVGATVELAIPSGNKIKITVLDIK